ncbi:hypothetical protein GLP59_02015 [Sulfitobacter sp. M220]|uniref:restriction endonuclease subunit S n=1 Tax=Roseobacteraceae TaxID=2854170 RepID=UPI001F8FF530|nr:hypothetical protein [Sulfitobacter sp. M22]MCF7776434.1 hypothetical protein [Sulfitobacter sp. M220]
MHKVHDTPRAAGSTFLEINKAEVARIRISVPHPDEQRKVSDFLSAIDVKIDAVTSQITQMETFKRGLLQKLFV